MRTTRRFVALAWVAPLFLMSCGSKPSGQVMLAIQTDVSIPKDIDQIRVEVSYVKTGVPAYQHSFTKFGDGDEAIRLPATIGFTSPEQDPTQPIRVRVIASQGHEDDASGEVPTVRILREVVTTVPTDRVASLPIPIEFLCDGSGVVDRDAQGHAKRDGSGNVIVKNRDCEDGQTCIAGKCVTRDLEVTKLEDFDVTQVFGGGDGSGNGVCFDTLSCIAGGTDAPLDLDAFAKDKSTCLAQASGAINVGLRTQGGGTCGVNGCYVALDASSDSGWKPGPTPGTIALPPAVCEKAKSDKIAGLIQSPIGAACPKKLASIPTCGPWAAVRSSQPPAASAPIAIAAGQESPASLALDPLRGMIYWTARGAFDAAGAPTGNGSVKATALTGGEPVTLAAKQKAPHGLALDVAARFAIWSDAAAGEIRWSPLAESPLAAPGAPPPAKTLVTGRLQPEGVSLFGRTLYWTELAGNKVYSVDTKVSGQDLILAAGATPTALVMTSGPAPRAIAAAADVTCWTYEDKLMSPTGTVACAMTVSKQEFVVSFEQSTPRAILLTTDASGNATSVVWANFDLASNNGGVFQIPLKAGVPTAQLPSTVARPDYPGGLAMDPDGKTFYWSSRSRGVVSRCTLSDCAGTKVDIATGQKNPGAIVVDSTSVYWVNEGTGASADGAIVKLAKAAPAQ
jgi:sugar lactone lactonase YvrE